MTNKQKKILTGTAVVLALLLGWYGCRTAQKLAEEREFQRLVRQSAEIAARVTPTPTPTPTPIPPDYVLHPDKEMPTFDYQGNACIGTLEIPETGLSWPVIDEWSYPRMRIAPCRYVGSLYQNDLVIMAHDYEHHFGVLKYLALGSEVNFTDAEGNRFFYKVDTVEVLEPDEVERMQTGDWDLTLFTCTRGGAARLTVRCVKTGEEPVPPVDPESIEPEPPAESAPAETGESS